MNLTVNDMIEAYQASEAGIDHDDKIWVETTVADLIHVEDSEESKNFQYRLCQTQVQQTHINFSSTLYCL